MPAEIRVPQMGESSTDATILRWLKKEGDAVSSGEAIVELETDKVNVEVPADSAGIIQSLAHAEGDTVAVGDILAVVGTAAEVKELTPNPGATAPDLPKGDGADRNGESASPPAAFPLARTLAEEANINLGLVKRTGPAGRITLARALHLLALALWLGGLVAIGALVAPTAFHASRSAPALAGNPALQNTLAGAVVGGSLRLFNFLCLACAAVLLAANGLLLPMTSRRWTGACLLTTLLLLASTLYLAFDLTPALDFAQLHGNRAGFDRMHHAYEQVSTLFQLPLLLLLAVFTALRDTPRRELSHR